MKKNLNVVDRIARIVLAIAFVILYLTNIVSGTFGLILLILALVFALTSVLSFCPIYWTLKISTLKKVKN